MDFIKRVYAVIAYIIELEWYKLPAYTYQAGLI